MRTIGHVPRKLAKARRTAVSITEVVNKWLATIITAKVRTLKVRKSKPVPIIYFRYPKMLLKYA